MGCVEFSHSALADLVTLSDAELVGVVTRRESPFNADFRPLDDLAAEAGAPVFFAAGNDQQAMADFLRSVEPTVIYCFGWSYLLGRDILGLAPKGVVGYHPAALPANRGRHPLIWALALGLSETASTFFFMDQGADSGDILDQQSIAIADSDDAASLYAKMTEVALGQINRFTAALAKGTEARVPQDHARANVWRKRRPADGQIDWRMSALSINNLVRALGRPYVGAHCLQGDREIKIWRVEPAAEGPANFEPGRILAIDGDAVVVKCADASVRILDHEFSPLPVQGSYL